MRFSINTFISIRMPTAVLVHNQLLMPIMLLWRFCSLVNTGYGDKYRGYQVMARLKKRILQDWTQTQAEKVKC